MINSINSNFADSMAISAVQNNTAKAPVKTTNDQSPELRKAFDSFVGQTFFGQMLQSMRKSVGKTAYFNGGRAEEIFQQQLDSVMAEKMSSASADQFSGPMFELFNLQRK